MSYALLLTEQEIDRLKKQDIIGVIKLVRERLALGLLEAKKLVDAVRFELAERGEAPPPTEGCSHCDGKGFITEIARRPISSFSEEEIRTLLQRIVDAPPDWVQTILIEAKLK